MHRQQHRARERFVERLAQQVHVAAQGVRVGRIVAPQGVRDFGARYCARVRFGQRQQDLIAGRVQAQWLAITRRGLCLAVDRQASDR